MMTFCCQVALLLSLAVAVSAYADMKLDCMSDSVTLVWTANRHQADTSLFRLGTCFPTSVTQREAVFSVYFSDCNFRRLVTGNRLLYTNNLTHGSSAKANTVPFSQSVICEYERPKDWYPSIYNPVFSTYSEADLVFHIELMNGDFSGPAESNSFVLGSLIPIMASVEHNGHQPLLLLLEECVAATSSELQPETGIYPIITNKGCLTDSKVSRSRFEERQNLSEIKLYLQAFRFGVGEEVFIHCKLVAWDPDSLDNTKKACHYNEQHRWELLDNAAYSSLCDCCEYSCTSRTTRSTMSGTRGRTQTTVLGPLTITDVNS